MTNKRNGNLQSCLHSISWSYNLRGTIQNTKVLPSCESGGIWTCRRTAGRWYNGLLLAHDRGRSSRLRRAVPDYLCTGESVSRRRRLLLPCVFYATNPVRAVVAQVKFIIADAASDALLLARGLANIRSLQKFALSCFIIYLSWQSWVYRQQLSCCLEKTRRV